MLQLFEETLLLQLLNSLRLNSTKPHSCAENPQNRKSTGSKPRIQLNHSQKTTKFHGKLERPAHYCGCSCGSYCL